MEISTDQIYIDKILQGDSNAYAYLIDKYKNMAYTIAIKIVKNTEDAEEVAQDSFLKAFQKLETFKGDSKFSTWLYTIIYRNAISKTKPASINNMTHKFKAVTSNNDLRNPVFLQLRTLF